MSVEFYGWGWSQDLTPTAKLVLLALCERASRTTREAWPSQANLARMTGFERRAIGNALKALEGSGLITRERRYRGDGSRSSDLFTLQLDVTAAATPSQGDSRSRDRESPREGSTIGGSMILDPGEGDAGSDLEPVMNPSTIPSSIPVSIEQRFIEFWEVYPRRVGRQHAQRVWSASVTADIVEAVLDGARAYAADRRFQDETYTMHPGRWLEARRWEDETPGPLGRMTTIDARNLATITQIFEKEYIDDGICHPPADGLAAHSRRELVPA